MTQRVSGCLTNMALAVVSLLAVFVVFETAARWILLYGNDSERFLQYASLKQYRAHPELVGALLRYTPHRYLGYYPTPNYRNPSQENRHNALGYRDDEIVLPKPADEIRIVCLGGSTTYTPCVGHYAYSYPNCVERELRARGVDRANVINAGADGWTSYETLINLEFRVADLEPDVVVIRDGLNDVFARLVWPPEAYRGDNSGYRAAMVGEVFMPNILEYSTLFRVLFVKSGWTQPQTALLRTLDTQHTGTFLAPEYEKQLRDATYPSGVFCDAPVERIFASNPPRYFERNLTATVRLARSLGIRPLLVDVACAPCDSLEGGVRPLVVSPAFRKEIDRTNENIERLANRLGVPFFSIAKAFPEDNRYYHDGVHVNFEGVQLEGRLFAEFLVDSGLLVPADPSHVPVSPEASAADSTPDSPL